MNAIRRLTVTNLGPDDSGSNSRIASSRLAGLSSDTPAWTMDIDFVGDDEVRSGAQGSR